MNTQKEEAILKYYKEGLNGHKIAELLELGSTTVYRILKKHSVTKSLSEACMKYTCDDSYFENIDTSEKAYWLGVLFADGSLSKKASKTGQIFFSSTDEEWVKSFLKAINSTNTPNKEYHKKFKKVI